jgi:hypothetical protein
MRAQLIRITTAVAAVAALLGLAQLDGRTPADTASAQAATVLSDSAWGNTLPKTKIVLNP